jgi:hypothetical protein
VGKYQLSQGTTACVKCAVGKYTNAKGSEECTGCRAGRGGKLGDHGASDESTHCIKCAAGKFQDEHSQAHPCKACARIDEHRYKWSAEGDTQCHDVPLDCIPSNWGSWGTCTKSCTPMTGDKMDVLGTSGTHTRMSRPEAVGSAEAGTCMLNDAATRAKWSKETGETITVTRCDMAWGGGKECSAHVLGGSGTEHWVESDKYWTQQDECNEHACPVDCVANPWEPWSACTKSCGSSGLSTRVRSVKIEEAYGGKPCVNTCPSERPDCEEHDLHKQTSSCNKGVTCELPTCQSNHVHCDIKDHTVNAARAWYQKIDMNGQRYYHNTIDSVKFPDTYTKPASFVECATPPTKRWHNSKTVDRDDINPYDTHVFGTFTKKRIGEFKIHVTPTCVNNQNCGLIDIGACHGCDTDQECKDMGISSTVFVTHHRQHMQMKHYNPITQKHEQVQYHCKREGERDCTCTCNGHTPCVVHANMLLKNTAIHGNAYPKVPTMQDCCNMCTNHPNCSSWEYSSSKMCELKTGSPQFYAAPSSAAGKFWSGVRAGEVG